MRTLRKGQSAIEYLMNYAWAIALIVIVGVAIFALDIGGLRSSVAGSGSRATAGAEAVSIVDFTYDGGDDDISFVLQNNVGNLINVTTISLVTVNDDSPGGTTSNSSSFLLNPGETSGVRIVGSLSSPDLSADNPFDVVVDIAYEDKNTGLTKTVRHDISGTVQA